MVVLLSAISPLSRHECRNVEEGIKQKNMCHQYPSESFESMLCLGSIQISSLPFRYTRTTAFSSYGWEDDRIPRLPVRFLLLNFRLDMVVLGFRGSPLSINIHFYFCQIVHS